MRKLLFTATIMMTMPAFAQGMTPEESSWSSCVELHVQDRIDAGATGTNEELLAEGYAKCKPEEEKYAATLPAEKRESELARVRATVASLVRLTHGSGESSYYE